MRTKPKIQTLFHDNAMRVGYVIFCKECLVKAIFDTRKFFRPPPTEFLIEHFRHLEWDMDPNHDNRDTCPDCVAKKKEQRRRNQHHQQKPLTGHQQALAIIANSHFHPPIDPSLITYKDIQALHEKYRHGKQPQSKEAILAKIRELRVHLGQTVREIIDLHTKSGGKMIAALHISDRLSIVVRPRPTSKVMKDRRTNPTQTPPSNHTNGGDNDQPPTIDQIPEVTTSPTHAGEQGVEITPLHFWSV
jgi:hypothetical protein